jgi:hypothetical protein
MESKAKGLKAAFHTSPRPHFPLSVHSQCYGGDLCFINIGGEPSGSTGLSQNRLITNAAILKIHNVTPAFHKNREWPSPPPTVSFTSI